MGAKKIFFIVGFLLILYFIISASQTAYDINNLEIENSKTKSIQDRKLNPDLNAAAKILQKSGPSLASPTLHHKPGSSHDTSATAVKIENSQEEVVSFKYAQIVPEYGDYAVTPKILNGNSAKIFSLTAPHYVIDDILIKGIQSAFVNGIYPSLDIIQILGLADIFEGTIYVGSEIEFEVTWNLYIDAKANPVLGIFSLQINGVEKSCKASASGPLKNVAILSNKDNGTILVQSCDKNFYMQLYRNSANSITGKYFEKSDATNEFMPIGNVSLYRRARDQ